MRSSNKLLNPYVLGCLLFSCLMNAADRSVPVRLVAPGQSFAQSINVRMIPSLYMVSSAPDQSTHLIYLVNNHQIKEFGHFKLLQGPLESYTIINNAPQGVNAGLQGATPLVWENLPSSQLVNPLTQLFIARADPNNDEHVQSVYMIANNTLTPVGYYKFLKEIPASSGSAEPTHVTTSNTSTIAVKTPPPAPAAEHTLIKKTKCARGIRTKSERPKQVTIRPHGDNEELVVDFDLGEKGDIKKSEKNLNKLFAEQKILSQLNGKDESPLRKYRLVTVSNRIVAYLLFRPSYQARKDALLAMKGFPDFLPGVPAFLKQLERFNDAHQNYNGFGLLLQAMMSKPKLTNALGISEAYAQTLNAEIDHVDKLLKSAVDLELN